MRVTDLIKHDDMCPVRHFSDEMLRSGYGAAKLEDGYEVFCLCCRRSQSITKENYDEFNRAIRTNELENAVYDYRECKERLEGLVRKLGSAMCTGPYPSITVSNAVRVVDRAAERVGHAYMSMLGGEEAMEVCDKEAKNEAFF